MNDLYLIGNGFDLAHGLKTSYNDFLLWYLKDSLQICNAKGSFSDNLMTVKRNGFQYTGIEDYDSLKKILEDMKRMEFSIKYNHDFLKKLVESYQDFKWVDIEYEYYMALVEIYRGLEKSNVIRSDFHFSQVKPLNDCFEAIKKKLVEYLKVIDGQEKFKNDKIEKILFEETGTEGNGKGTKMYVYFNYTSTLDFYTKNTWNSASDQNIYIHGLLYENMDSVIFGYGDEMDLHYQKIENLNNNEFLKNIKSFGYLSGKNGEIDHLIPV